MTTMLADTAERLDFLARDLRQHEIQFLQSRVPFQRAQRGHRRLRQDQCLPHRLFAGRKIG